MSPQLYLANKTESNSLGPTKRRAKVKALWAEASFCLDFLFPFWSSKKEKKIKKLMRLQPVRTLTNFNFNGHIYGHGVYHPIVYNEF